MELAAAVGCAVKLALVRVDTGNGVTGAVQVGTCAVGQLTVDGLAAVLSGLGPDLLECGQMV